MCKTVINVIKLSWNGNVQNGHSVPQPSVNKVMHPGNPRLAGLGMTVLHIRE